MKTACIDTNTLVNHFQDRLSNEEKDRLFAHLADCDACLNVFVSANAVLMKSDMTHLEQTLSHTGWMTEKPSEDNGFRAAGTGYIAEFRKRFTEAAIDFRFHKSGDDCVRLDAVCKTNPDATTPPARGFRITIDRFTYGEISRPFLYPGGLTPLIDLRFGACRIAVVKQGEAIGAFQIEITDAGIYEI